MAYKMKGPSLYLNKEGYKNAPDGRAKSSAFQQKTKEKTFEDYMDEGFSPEEATQMAETGATTGNVNQKSSASVKPDSEADKKSKKNKKLASNSPAPQRVPTDEEARKARMKKYIKTGK